MTAWDRPCAVIGHGAAAGWIAVMLKERYDLPELHVLTHGRPFEGTGELAELIERYGIEVHTEEIREILGLVQGHTVFAVWLGKDLSAIVRLILGGELTEYTEMMGSARSVAAARMTAQAAEMGADAVINVRYMTTSVVGSAAELLVYGTAVKLG